MLTAFDDGARRAFDLSPEQAKHIAALLDPERPVTAESGRTPAPWEAAS